MVWGSAIRSAGIRSRATTTAGRALAQAALAELPDEDARGRGDMQRWLDEHPAR